MKRAWKASPIVLRYFDTYKDFSDQDLAGLLEWSELREYKEGQILISQGDPGELVLYILNGAVKLSRRIYSSQTPIQMATEVVVQIFGSGEAIGDASIYEDFEYKGTLTAVTDTEVLVIDRKALANFADVHPYVLKNLYNRASRKLLRMVEGVDLSYGTLLDRIEVLATECKKVDIDLYKQFSKAEIARMLGVSRVSVSKQINSVSDVPSAEAT